MFKVVSYPTREANLLNIAVSNKGLVISDVTHINMHEVSNDRLIYCDINVNCNTTYTLSFKTYKDLDTNEFKADLDIIDWNVLYSTDYRH